MLNGPMTILGAPLLAASANDNFKRVAARFGGGAMDRRKALAWATVATLAGSASALFVVTRLISTLGRHP